MPNIIKAQGIVLNTTPFRETSLFATIFTKQYGKVRVLAKGCRRPRSKMCGGLEKFNLIEIIYYKRETKDTYTISDTTILEDFQKIRQRPQAVNAALILCEFFYRTLPAEDPDPRSYALFEMYLKTLQTIDDTAVKRLAVQYLLRVLSTAGVSPHLDTCVRCHHPIQYNNKHVDFSISGGGVVCDKDYDNTVVFLSSDALQAMQCIYQKGSSPMNDKVLAELEHMLPDYLYYHLDGLILNTFKHLK